MNNQAGVVDLTSEDDDAALAAALSLSTAESGVAKRPIELILSDDDDSIVAVVKKRSRNLAGTGQLKSGYDTDDSVVVVDEVNTRDQNKKRAAVPKLEIEKSPLLQILEVFPDVKIDHVTQLLQKHRQHVATVLQVLVESSYPKSTPRKQKTVNTAGAGVLIAHRIEGEHKWSYDFSSESAFVPDKQYTKEAKQLLQQDFRFLSSKTIDVHFKASKYHYSICHDRIEKAIMLREKATKDGSVEYEQYMLLDQAMRGQSLGRKQLLELMKDMELKKHEILMKKQRKSCKVLLEKALLKEELDYLRMKQADWRKRMQNYQQRKVDRRKAEEEHATIECNCCYSDVSPEELVQCTDGHLFCTDCLKAFAETKIFADGNLGTHPHTKEPAADLLCMSGCGSAFSLENLKKALPKRVLTKYGELQYQAAIANVEMDDLCSCPKCDYQAVLPTTEMIFRCPVGDCLFESCRKCGEEPHIPLKCEEVEKKHQTSGRLRVEEAISEAKIRTCPKCSKKFVKDAGCNKMTCACGVHICYMCRVVIPKSVGYTHFCQKAHCDHKNCGNCILYSNAEEDDKQAMREAGLKAAEEVRGDSLLEGEGGAGEVAVDVDNILQAAVPAVARMPASRARGAMLAAQMPAAAREARVAERLAEANVYVARARQAREANRQAQEAAQQGRAAGRQQRQAAQQQMQAAQQQKQAAQQQRQAIQQRRQAVQQAAQQTRAAAGRQQRQAARRAQEAAEQQRLAPIAMAREHRRGRGRRK